MKPIAALAVAVALLGMTGTFSCASAQQPSPQDDPWDSPGYMMGPGMMGPRGMMGMGPWMMGGQGAAMCAAMAGHIEGRLAYIKTELKITEAQEPLWKSYAGAARDNAQAMSAHCTAMMGKNGLDKLSLPDRLDQHEQFMAAQLDALRTMNKALKPLYAALTDTQKQAANQLFWGPMGMM